MPHLAVFDFGILERRGGIYNQKPPIITTGPRLISSSMRQQAAAKTFCTHLAEHPSGHYQKTFPSFLFQERIMWSRSKLACPLAYSTFRHINLRPSPWFRSQELPIVVLPALIMESS